MTHLNHYTLKAYWVGELLGHGLEGLLELLRILLGAAIQAPSCLPHFSARRLKNGGGIGRGEYFLTTRQE